MLRLAFARLCVVWCASLYNATAPRVTNHAEKTIPELNFFGAKKCAKGPSSSATPRGLSRSRSGRHHSTGITAASGTRGDTSHTSGLHKTRKSRSMPPGATRPRAAFDVWRAVWQRRRAMNPAARTVVARAEATSLSRPPPLAHARQPRCSGPCGIARARREGAASGNTDRHQGRGTCPRRRRSVCNSPGEAFTRHARAQGEVARRAPPDAHSGKVAFWNTYPHTAHALICGTHFTGASVRDAGGGAACRFDSSSGAARSFPS